MPVVDVYNIAGEKVREIQLDDSVFGCEVKPHLLHDVVIWQRANKRAATAKTKTRAEVSGGGKKPWRQKGTGRARSGSNRSPVWRHGGVVFGPNNRNYVIGLPKKVRRAALCSALSMKTTENMLKVVDAFAFDTNYTEKEVNTILRRFHVDTAALRRYLVDNKLMAREGDGTRYWRLKDGE